jgi:hypothetical protein
MSRQRLGAPFPEQVGVLVYSFLCRIARIIALLLHSSEGLLK